MNKIEIRDELKRYPPLKNVVNTNPHKPNEEDRLIFQDV